MSIPLRQALMVGAYVLKQRLRGRQRFPLVLMLEPLFRCNLACAGCGKIQHPTAILRQNLSPADCFQAVEECGAPVVSIAPVLKGNRGEARQVVEFILERFAI